MTLRACLKQVSKQKRQLHPQLEKSANPPRALFYLWETFIELYRSGEVMAYQEILAWTELNHFKLSREEIKIVKHLERLANGR